ncbi:hypothetical protein [Bacillus litorisediminis]|uniref:hypothetical protein n=1 Tax=Bacillus litorisediminis TaxID=2922713 RepID=UPI001FAC586B|nr:hypothetical protein [Bacillus litorisediminis]
MKKALFVVSLFVVGGTITGYAITNAYKPKVETNIQAEVKDEEAEIERVVDTSITKPEYDSFVSFIGDYNKFLNIPNHDWEKINLHAILSYIDHFENQIVDLGLTAEVDEFEKIVFEMENNQAAGRGDLNKQLVENFKSQLWVLHEQIFSKQTVEMFGKQVSPVEYFQLTKPEFSSVEEFIKWTAESWAEGSEFRRTFGNNEDPAYSIADSVVHYVNYFALEIEEKGGDLGTNMKILQEIAYKMGIAQRHPELDIDVEYLKQEFEERLNFIMSKL